MKVYIYLSQGKAESEVNGWGRVESKVIGWEWVSVRREREQLCWNIILNFAHWRSSVLCVISKGEASNQIHISSFLYHWTLSLSMSSGSSLFSVVVICRWIRRHCTVLTSQNSRRVGSHPWNQPPSEGVCAHPPRVSITPYSTASVSVAFIFLHHHHPSSFVCYFIKSLTYLYVCFFVFFPISYHK